MTNTTETARLYVPAGSRKVTDKATGAVVYLSETRGVPYAVGYTAKAFRPSFNYRFRSEESRTAHVTKFLAGIRAHKAATLERRAEAKAKRRKLQVGHVLVCSWGYEQTNVDFYQVTKLVGAQSVEIRKIASTMTEATGWAQGKVVPLNDQFTGEPMIKRVSDGDRVKLESYAFARLWAGKPVYESSYH